jgi:benzoyl-CoA reductase/2-hydroxyglutaryl-CoA dehydratase subunit BcrC/BadD/HgdB
MKYINEDDLLNSLAEAYTRIYLNIGVDQMADTVIEMIHKYGVDGLVMHSNRSCKPYSFGKYDIEKIVKAKTGIPTLMIEADMVDDRNFAESQIDTRIDVFMEILEKARQQ